MKLNNLAYLRTADVKTLAVYRHTNSRDIAVEIRAIVSFVLVIKRLIYINDTHK